MKVQKMQHPIQVLHFQLVLAMKNNMYISLCFCLENKEQYESRCKEHHHHKHEATSSSNST
eukprot:4691081-Ditylum_brightwellii.AAC.1